MAGLEHVRTGRMARANARRLGAAAWLAPALALLAWCTPMAHAQLLVGVTLSTAIATQFDPGVRLPVGSVRAVGSGTKAIIARVPDRSRWTGWEVYAARGLMSKLQNAYVNQVVEAFAAAGYLESGRTSRVVGSEHRTHIVFRGNDGERLLYVIRTSQEVVWLTARSQ